MAQNEDYTWNVQKKNWSNLSIVYEYGQNMNFEYSNYPESQNLGEASNL